MLMLMLWPGCNHRNVGGFPEMDLDRRDVIIAGRSAGCVVIRVFAEMRDRLLMLMRPSVRQRRRGSGEPSQRRKDQGKQSKRHGTHHTTQ